MRAIEIRDESLALCERPLPDLRPGKVLIQVHAAGVNRADILQRKGLYPPPRGASDIPGLEVAGVIEHGAGEWRAGDRVCALTTGGGYAEYCVAPATSCLLIPKGLSFSDAASLPETCFTVWGSVFDLAELSKDETLLVTGGSSGIGVTAIQMARALGHRVFALAGSPEKCAACVQLGAARAFDYRREDFVGAVRESTQGRGIDVVLDMAGGEMLRREIDALAPDGRIAMIGFMDGAKATLDLATFLFKRISLRAFTLRARSDDFKAAIARAIRGKVWPLIEQRKIKPIVHSTFGFEEAHRAHELMESGGHIGKIVLIIK